MNPLQQSDLHEVRRHDFALFVYICSKNMDFEVLKKLTLTRQTIKEFNSRQLDPGVLEEILGYSLVME